MNRGPQGKYITVSTVGEKVSAFIPTPLSFELSIDWSPSLREKFDQALLALGRLDSVSVLVPNTSILLYVYVRKEAVLSSQIEGTQSSLADLLLFETEQEPGVPIEDVQEVSNYVEALTHGLKRLEDGFPLSLRLLKEIHALLLSKGRGSHQMPGEFRRTQNWIGGSRPGNAVFVPPPPDNVGDCMGELERFLHVECPALLKAALAHVQFETIHPFLDGNGRLGRLLITLLLSSEKVLREPLLYLSLYFKRFRQRYYDLLTAVRVEGDWESWLEFFAEAVAETASEAVSTAKSILSVAEEDEKKIEGLGRVAASVTKVHGALLEHPIASGGWITEKTGLSPATVYKSLEHLQALGVVQELTERRRNRLFSYSHYVSILNRGTELRKEDR